ASGARAFERLCGTRSERTGSSAIARMSAEALRCAQELDHDDVGATCAWLYSFNRAPRTPQVAQRWSDPAAYERETGLSSRDIARTLNASWSAYGSHDEPSPWRVWLAKQ